MFITQLIYQIAYFLLAVCVIFLSGQVAYSNPVKLSQTLKAIPNLSSIVLKQATPQSGIGVQRSFYANSVELEPFTLTLCGTPVGEKDNSVIYKTVPASEITKVRFFTSSFLTLNAKWNPDHTIPLIHNGSPSSDFSKADPGEPDFSAKDSSKMRVLLAYDESTNYYHAYQHEGFYLGGVASAVNVMQAREPGTTGRFTPSMLMNSANDCFSEERPGVGETVVRLYLLATRALSNTQDIKIYATAKSYLDGKEELLNEGPISYTTAEKTAVSIADVNVGQTRLETKIKNSASFYSYFTSKVRDKNNAEVIEKQRGFPVCQVALGARFHNLFRYTDHDSKGRICRTVSKAHSVYCNLPSCSHEVAISNISLKKIPLHDMYTDNLIIGAQCPQKSGLIKGGVNFKPLLNSSSTVLDFSSDFLNSYTGGVGAYYYTDEKNKDNQKRVIWDNPYGGNNHIFYFYSYHWGEKPNPGNACGWWRSMKAIGHDMFGNPVSIEYKPANGSSNAEIVNASS